MTTLTIKAKLLLWCLSAIGKPATVPTQEQIDAMYRVTDNETLLRSAMLEIVRGGKFDQILSTLAVAAIYSGADNPQVQVIDL